MNKVIRNRNPYVLDTIGSIKALTKKNSRIVDLVISLSPKYSKAASEIDNWFKKMKSGGTYAICLENIIRLIDSFNSTHLNTSRNGRKEMKNRLLSNYPNSLALEIALSKPFIQTNSSHPIYVLTSPIPSTKKGGGTKHNLSFASKFCAYAARCLLGKDLYSKYDNVLRDNLGKYIKEYLPKAKKHSYKPKARTFSEYLDIYKVFSDDIEEILKEKRVAIEGYTRYSFDRLVWCCYK